MVHASAHHGSVRFFVGRFASLLNAHSDLFVVTGSRLACALAACFSLGVTMALLQAVFPSLDDVLHFSPRSFVCLLMREFSCSSASNALLHITHRHAYRREKTISDLTHHVLVTDHFTTTAAAAATTTTTTTTTTTAATITKYTESTSKSKL